MPEHVDSPECGCWGCISVAVESVGVCVVHAAAEPDRQAPASAPGRQVCLECEERMRADLKLVAERWDAAQDALHPSVVAGGGSERHAGSSEPPVPLNVKVSDLLSVARDKVWLVVVGLVDRVLEVRLPDDTSTPGVAEWVERWQLSRVVGHDDRAWVHSVYWSLADAADAIASATHGSEITVEIPGHRCRRPGCGGKLAVVEGRTGSRIVRCEADAKHAVQWDDWSQMLRASRPQRRGARPPRLAR